MTKILERQTKEQKKGKNNRRRPIFYSTIQLVVVNLYTKFEVTILNGCGDIFDEKSGKKEKGREEQIGECAFAISQYKLVLANLYTKFEVSILNGCGDIFDENSGEKEKRTNTGKNK